MRTRDTTIARLADEFDVPVGAFDAFVFRRVDGGRMVHLGGHGQGTGWAGIVEIHLESEPLIRHAWSMRRPTRQRHPASAQAFGPYWATTTVVVPLLPDQVVVFGSDHQLQMPEDAVVEQLATDLADHIDAVSPAKRLADELELLHAVRRATATATADVHGVARHIITAAAEALSCELGLLWLPDRQILAIVDQRRAASGSTAALADPDDAAGTDTDGLVTMMDQLLASPRALPRCQQDNREHPLPPPLGADSGVVAWFAVALGAPVDGLLVLCHTVVKPRGFTLLCQQIGNRIAEAAATPLAIALAHDHLNDALARANDEARRDPLTGVLNRLGWRDAVDDLAHDRRGGTISVVMLDVDGLKAVNDAHGHRAGDTVLRAVSGALLDATRDGDIVARIGGDEFAVLLPDTDERACATVVRRFTEHLNALEPIGDRAVAASIGWSSSAGPDDLDRVLREADERMYDVKNGRSRR